jgi:hypothetical protein
MSKQATPTARKTGGDVRPFERKAASPWLVFLMRGVTVAAFVFIAIMVFAA